MSDASSECALPLSGVKVMLIDDSIAVRHDGEVLLSQTGCRVMLAEDSFDGLSKIAHSPPDMVLVDAKMPHLDGYQICALIKKHLPHLDIPVILLVNEDSSFDPARAEQSGAEQYLVKPFNRECLVKTVTAHRPHPANGKGLAQIKNLLQVA